MADLYHEDTGRVYTLDIPIEYYHGYDSGERWTEGSRSTAHTLSAVPAGAYVLRIAVERSEHKKNSVVAITITQDVFRWRSGLLALFLITIIPVLVFLYHFYFDRRRWSQSDSGHWSDRALAQFGDD
jgi:hypothetical protein